jgi:dolichyl-phosphate beta-glucosyltransferase
MITLSIVIPFFNEEARIQGCIDALTSWKPPKAVALERVYFVNDGSTDKTVSKIKSQKSKIEKTLKAKAEIISYEINRGKGYAVVRGMAASDSDYTLFIDADMATPLIELNKFLPLMKNGTDIIVGTRKNGKSTVITHQPKYREIMGKGFTILSNIMLNTWVTDFTCGFKAFSKTAKNNIFPKLICNRWSFDSESLFLGRISGYSIREVPVVWSDHRGSKVNVLIDAPRSLVELLRIRANHLPFQTLTAVKSAAKPALAFAEGIRTIIF